MSKELPKAKQKNTFSLTQMLDILFIMLICFIVMASFLQIRSLTGGSSTKSDVDEPKASTFYFAGRLARRL